MNDHEHLGKFDSKSDTSVFLGYSNNSKAYCIFNMRTQTIIESTNIVIDDYCDFSEFSKEYVISSLIEEIGDETTKDQPIAAPNKTGSGPNKNVSVDVKLETRYCET